MTTALLYNSEQVNAAEHLVVFVPGVLSRVQIFDEATAHLPANAAPAYYRFPGLDGLQIAPALDVERAAGEIAMLASSYPRHELTLVGYSGGAAIVLEASQLLENGRSANLALISPTPPLGGGLATRLRTSRDVLSVALHLGSFDIATIWPEYWKILAFGRQNYRTAERQEDTVGLLEQQREHLVLPQGEIVPAHTRSLQTWTLREDFDPEGLRIGVFYGAEDPVFSERQTLGLIQSIGTVTRVERYVGQGHILTITEPELFPDVFAFTM